MAKETVERLIIAAPKEKIFRILADFPQYPLWSKDIKNVTILDDKVPPTKVKFTVEAVWIKETYELQYEWFEAEKGVSWELQSSSLQKSQSGRITLHDYPQGTEVIYSIFVELKVPLISPLRRKIQSYITHTALQSLEGYAQNSIEDATSLSFIEDSLEE